MTIHVDLSNKTALVTGASSGLGAHFASVLAESGAKVILAARRAEALDVQVAAIVEAGGTAEWAVFDAADPQSIENLWRAIEAVDIVINNAGVAVGRPALEQNVADWDRLFDTNLKGAFFMAQGAARKMRDAGKGGSIVNIASILGLRTGNGVSTYAISKAALIHMTKSLALEWARFGIRVNALCPGYLETDLNRDFFASEAGQAMIKRIPQRRLGVLDELTGPLLLLASDASRYMTGAELVVDGGHLVSPL